MVTSRRIELAVVAGWCAAAWIVAGMTACGADVHLAPGQGAGGAGAGSSAGGSTEDDAGGSAENDGGITDAGFEGYEPPVPGMYEPENGKPCANGGGGHCGPNAGCFPDSGWCCGGDIEDGECRCGKTLGCIPPEVCCAFDGALELVCAHMDECPNLW